MATNQKKTKVTSKNFGDLLIESVEQGLQYTRGEITLRETAARLASTPPNFTSKAIKKMRVRFDLTQDLLAQVLGVKPSAVKHWEQGLRKPSASVRRLLQIIEAEPEILEKIA